MNGAAKVLALVFHGVLLPVVAGAWWWVLIRHVGRWSLPLALLGGVVGSAVMVWVFVALLEVPDGYRC
ncbi:hypothetical protein ACQEVM_35565 [Streptomyces sp. CA-243310]|uniref:hypothetical protein n=1 Tax=Streptomyces sp. CA-243310 TaxID=3240056 RepID=UPI003D9220CF